MAITTNVPPIVWSSTGLIIPSDSQILTGVQADWQAALGSNLNIALNTPQGQLMQAQTAAISNAYAQVAFIVNGMDPDLNDGFMQDVIGRIYYQNRIAGTPTTVACVVSGATGAPIPPNTPIAVDANKNLYVTTTTGVSIPSTGNVTLVFQCVTNGPISVGIGEISLNQAVTGIDSISNLSAGVPGSLVESRGSFEWRRENSVASNSQGSADAILGQVLGVADVVDAYVYNNDTNSDITIGSTHTTIIKNSVYVAVIGGASADVAQAIWVKKDLGCSMNGNTSVTVYDNNYPTPPSYTIKFNDNTSSPVTIPLVINIKNSSQLPSTIVADVQAAAAAAFVGQLPSNVQPGTLPVPQRVRIASLFTPISLVPYIAACEGPSVFVQVISTFLGSAFSGTGTLVNSSTTLTVASVVSGSLTPGSVVSGVSIPNNTTIIRQLTGTMGGVGTYQMSAAATGTVSSPESITASATGTSQFIGIDQGPVLGPVTVNLI